MRKTLSVLNVEDSERDALLIRHHLSRAGYEPTFLRVDTAASMTAALEGRTWDVILSDHAMPQFSALKALAVLKETGLDIPFIIISGTIGEELAVEAMHAGANDYVMKDKLGRLAAAIEREMEEAGNRRAHKAAEAALRESEERYRLLFDRNPHPTYVVDRENHRILAVNEATAVRYGYSHEELLAMTVEDLWPTEEIERLDEGGTKLSLVSPQGETWKHRRKDGATIDVESTIHELLFAGKPAYYVLAQDVTERRVLEEKLEQFHKMEAIGLLAGGIAHDFSNVLTVINGRSDLAIGSLKVEDPLRHDLEQIRKAGDRAATLTRQLLAFSRKQVLQPVSVDLNEVVSDLQGMLGRIIGKDIALRIQSGPSLNKIKADRDRIVEVVMNLVLNARDAMPKGGHIAIKTENIYLTPEEARNLISTGSGHYVRLTVRDNGVGMTPETLARIFDPYFTTKRSSKGNGLGLSTVYGIVKQSGGSISVQTELGKGSTFQVYLPQVGEEARAAVQTATSAVRSLEGTETVLLTDDDELVCRLASKFLATHGYRVLQASSGNEAISICESQKNGIDLLITDIVMSEINGWELAERLAKTRPNMKILFVSGYFDSAKNQPPMHETTPFLPKPFAPLTLLHKVRQVLDQQPGRLPS